MAAAAAGAAIGKDWSPLNRVPVEDLTAGPGAVPPLTDISSSDSGTNSGANNGNGSSTSSYLGEDLYQDEALRRWALAEAHDKEHAYGGMKPLENDAVGEAVAVVTMLFSFSWVYIGPLLSFYALWAMLASHSWVAVAYLALLALLAVAPAAPSAGSYGRSYIWQCWRRYFRMRWVTPNVPYLEPGRHYMFCHFPHAVFPIGSWLSIGLTGKDSVTGILERTTACAATILLHLPGVRHMLIWMGCIPAGRADLLSHLRRQSVGIVPEGTAGIFRGATRKREQVYFSPRKGVCQIALLTGTPLVPVFIFGQSQVFTFKGPEMLSRRLRAAVGVYWGRWCLPLPHKTDLVMAIGRPIEVEQELAAAAAARDRPVRGYRPLNRGGRGGHSMVVWIPTELRGGARVVRVLMGPAAAAAAVQNGQGDASATRSELKVADPSRAQVEELHSRVEAAVAELYDRHNHLLPVLDGKQLKIV